MTIDPKLFAELLELSAKWDAELTEIYKPKLNAIIGALEEEAIKCLNKFDSIWAQREDMCSRNELEEALDDLRAERQKIADVNEEFDLDGEDHLRLLRLIKAVIIVTSLNTDIYATYSQKLRQAAYAREKRRESPEEIALVAIIQQLLGNAHARTLGRMRRRFSLKSTRTFSHSTTNPC